jgi:hypothetical protein
MKYVVLDWFKFEGLNQRALNRRKCHRRIYPLFLIMIPIIGSHFLVFRKHNWGRKILCKYNGSFHAGDLAIDAVKIVTTMWIPLLASEPEMINRLNTPMEESNVSVGLSFWADQ